MAKKVYLQDLELTGGGSTDGVKRVNLTQEEYDALTEKDPDTLYITDGEGGGGGGGGTVDQHYNSESTHAQSGTAVAEAVAGKQSLLIAGENIKTINNQTLLGPGNIDIQGGGTVSWDNITDKPTFADTAFSSSYRILEHVPIAGASIRLNDVNSYVLRQGGGGSAYHCYFSIDVETSLVENWDIIEDAIKLPINNRYAILYPQSIKISPTNEFTNNIAPYISGMRTAITTYALGKNSGNTSFRPSPPDSTGITSQYDWSASSGLDYMMYLPPSVLVLPDWDSYDPNDTQLLIRASFSIPEDSQVLFSPEVTYFELTHRQSIPFFDFYAVVGGRYEQ